ncbi:MAG: trehalose-phosphatase [Deltaproteobacteria bacterium]|nr:trehalose-phosphatase [Deltaproteobacteria bacterium]
MKHPTSSPFVLSRFRFDAVVFDLDGVITQTARVHAAAWKALFDEFRDASGGRWKPFDQETDYPLYVDAKPRVDGIRSFLESRGLEMPEGSMKDPAGKATIHGLGNRKNQLFLEKLKRDGVEPYQSAVGLVRSLRERSVAAAVVSSSKNCVPVLESAGLAELFDVRVDGVLSEELGLKGKPAPDIFLEAAKRLKVQPERAVVLEDALSGVEAGRRGGFGRVIGVDRTGHASDLLEAGAHQVVEDLSEIELAARLTGELPSALHALGDLAGRFDRETPVVFLDYDGTLTPIVKKPEWAVLADDMRRALKTLSAVCTVGVVSGRDLQDVKQLVGLDDIVYAGSHGFDILGPERGRMNLQKGGNYLDDLDSAEASLDERLATIRGALVERKKYSIAVHYRNVDEEDVPAVQEAVDRVHDEHPRLKKGSGKKVFEIQPDIDWNKGRALLWILEALDLEGPEWIPVYIGDDVTDEYGFGALRTREGGGVGIAVTEEDRFSEAGLVLKDPEEVRVFLESLASLVKGRKKKA